LILPWLGWCAALLQAILCQLTLAPVLPELCLQALIVVIDKVNSLLVTTPIQQVQVSLPAADVHPCSFVGVLCVRFTMRPAAVQGSSNAYKWSACFVVPCCKP
jgi:hypothetical protein